MSKRSKKRSRGSGETSVSPPSATVPLPPGPSRLWTLAICLGLALLVAVPYAQVARHGFIQCDDNDYVSENPRVQQGLTWEGIEWAFGPHAANWHPLTWMSHMLDCQWFGLDGGRHHLMSVAIHAAAAIVLFLALRLMTGTLWPSAVVAALFAVHPLHVESVAWAAERKDVLSGLLAMLTLLGYGWYVRRPGVLRYLLVFIAFALGLMAKSMLVTLPCVLLLLDIWPLGRWLAFRKSDAMRSGAAVSVPLPARSLKWLLLEKLPLVALTIGDCILTADAQQRGSAISSLSTLPLDVRLANAMISYVAYLGKMFWPLNLSIFYTHPGILSRGYSATTIRMAIGATILLIVVTVAVVWLARRRPYLAVGWFWYLGMLVPVIGLVQVGVQGMADRYTYLPSIGISLMVVWTAYDLAIRWPRSRAALAVAASAAIMVCTVLTSFQVSYWKDSYTLFAHSIDAAQDNYFAYNRLGMAYFQDGKIDKAIAQLEQALVIHPRDTFSLHNLGACYLEQNELDKAEACFLRVLAMDHDCAETLNSLGSVYGGKNRLADALKCHAKAHQLSPEKTSYLLNTGIDYARLGQKQQAAKAFLAALRLDPNFAQAKQQLAILRAEIRAESP